MPFLVAFALSVRALAQQPEIRLVRVASGLTNPVDIQPARDGSGRLFIVQQNGVIRLLLPNGTLAAAPFLDIGTRTRVNGECGLLGLAFPPGFADQPQLYVNYTNAACTESVVARYRVSGDANVADRASEQVILRQAQPFQNHNGGRLAFGPDGYLYVGFGDGGDGGDPQNNGQNTATFLAKILRIDTESGASPYAVPRSNPFAANPNYKPEIWALGLRNPWRFSFDRQTGDLWIGDVGQDRAEEVDFQPAASQGGEDYGWRLMEGLSCFNPAQNCNRAGLTLPVLEYTHAQGDLSITGGFVYRGSRWPSLSGTYVYGDYSSGRIWGLRHEGALFNNRLLLSSRLNISAFGEDEAGELYLASHGSGEVYRIEASAAPQFTSRSVANAASFDLGMTPGSAAVVFAGGVRTEGVTVAPSVPLPRVLDGVKVTVNGRDAPLFALANVGGQEQVNFQVPWETESSPAQVVVSRDGAASPAVDVPTPALQPGIFQLNATDAIVVRTSDNSLATAARPLRPGESVYFYSTGLGPVDNNPGSGNGGPGNPLARTRGVVTVSIDGAPCEVLFAGLAPGFVGIYQVNILVPASVRSGQRDMVVSVGGAHSKAARVGIQ